MGQLSAMAMQNTPVMEPQLKVLSLYELHGESYRPILGDIFQILHLLIERAPNQALVIQAPELGQVPYSSDSIAIAYDPKHGRVILQKASQVVGVMASDLLAAHIKHRKDVDELVQKGARARRLARKL